MHQKKKPRIDILLATFNGEKYLDKQLQSIFNQSYRNFRVLVRDDGSTDGTGEIIQHFLQRDPSRIDLIRAESQSRSAKKNFSLIAEYSDAKYLMFCDQDDVWVEKKLEISLDAIMEIEGEFTEQLPILIHTDSSVIDSSNQIIHPSFFEYMKIDPGRTSLNHLVVQNVVTGNTVICNRALADLAFPIPDEALMHDWWLALVASALGIIRLINRPTLDYRQHGDNVVGARGYNIKHDIGKFLRIWRDESEIVRGYFIQAQELSNQFGDFLPPEKSIILDAFLSLMNSTLLEKNLKMLKFDFSKGNLLQTIGLHLAISKINFIG